MSERVAIPEECLRARCPILKTRNHLERLKPRPWQKLSIHATRSPGILRSRSRLSSTEGCTPLKAPGTTNDTSDKVLQTRHASCILSTNRLSACSADLRGRPPKLFSGSSLGLGQVIQPSHHYCLEPFADRLQQ
jgi:hypothetical protein